MQTKTLLGGLIGGIACFLLGWLIFGILLMDFYTANSISYAGMVKDPPDFIFIFLGNLAWAFMVAYVFQIANIRTVRSGAITGGIIFLLTTLGYDFLYYGQMNLFHLKMIPVDAIANFVMGLVIGAILGWWFGRGKNDKT